jgi:hypothetical protein
MPKKIKFRPPQKRPKSERQAHRHAVKTLDLHNLDIDGTQSIESLVYHVIDSFISPLLFQTGKEICIVVGRGLNSNRGSLKDGMPTLRFYTQQYLTQIGVMFQYSNREGSFNVFL